MKFKVSLNSPIPFDCKRVTTIVYFKNPTVVLGMVSGQVDGVLGTETEHETQCLADGDGHSSEIALTGLVDLKGECRISLNARTETPNPSPETENKGIFIGDSTDNEAREINLSIP